MPLNVFLFLCNKISITNIYKNVKRCITVIQSHSMVIIQKKYRGVPPTFIPRVTILILSSISCLKLKYHNIF